MTAEPDFNAHVDCFWCGTRKYRQDTIIIDDRFICRKDCEHEYRKATRPGVVPDTVGFYDKG